MTKLEQLAHVANGLPEEQIDGLIAFARYLAGNAYFDRAPPEALASIDRGLLDLAAGRVQAADAVLERLRAKIGAGQA